MKKYSLTPQHRAMLRPWHEKWVKIAMRTDPQTEADRAAMRDAINGLYGAAGLSPPKHIVFVPSPVVGQIASGFAAAIWHMSEGFTATRDATWAATMAATWAATMAATEAATWNATWDATRDATRDMTWAATMAATMDATEAATGVKSWAWQMATAIAPNAVDFLLECANSALRMYSGGNMWAAGVDLISFFRHVAGLNIDYSKWVHYEAAAIHGGFRFMHPKFCIVVDFPGRILIDASNRPHCDDGPSHRWRDGFEIYHWHGYRIPPDKTWIITDKPRITAATIMAEPNAELRRIMCEVTAFEPIRSIAKVISEDQDGNGHPRRLLRANIAGGEIRIAEVVNGSLEPDGSRRRFLLGAMPGGTPHDVIAASYGIAPKHYKEAVRT